MKRNRPSPHSEATALVAGVESVITVKGPTDPGVKAVHYVSLSHDEGKIAAITLQDVTAKIIPQRDTAVMGGNQAHAFYGQPAPQGQARNTIYLGFTLPASEDVELTLLSPIGGTIRWTLLRFLDYGQGDLVPAPIGPGGMLLV